MRVCVHFCMILLANFLRADRLPAAFHMPMPLHFGLQLVFQVCEFYLDEVICIHISVGLTTNVIMYMSNGNFNIETI